TGGGIFNQTGASATLTGTAVVSNTAAGSGAGISNSGLMTLTNSSVLSNTTAGAGGGFYDQSGTLKLFGSLVQGNTAAANGGGLNYRGNTTVDLNNATLTNNQADNDHNAVGEGGGFFISNDFVGTVNLKNTLLAGNLGLSTSPDGSGAFTSLGYNLIGVITGT